MLDYSKKRNIEDRKQDTEREKDESQKFISGQFLIKGL